LRYSAVSVPPQYEENFKKAIWAFQFQRVYDPASEDIVHLSGIPHGLSEDDFLGPYP
jgi:exonuclease-1